MDISIARIHISVRRIEREPPDPRPLLSSAERVAHRAAQIARVEQQREQIRTWRALQGWR